MKKPEENLLKFLDSTCPAMVRIMSIESGKGRKPRLKPLMSIVKDSGLSRRTVQRLALEPTWKGIKVGVASQFIEGAGVNILHNNRPQSSDEKRMTRYYFYRHYIEKDLPHLTQRQRERFYALMGWNNEYH